MANHAVMIPNAVAAKDIDTWTIVTGKQIGRAHV